MAIDSASEQRWQLSDFSARGGPRPRTHTEPPRAPQQPERSSPTMRDLVEGRKDRARTDAGDPVQEIRQKMAAQEDAQRSTDAATEPQTAGRIAQIRATLASIFRK